MARENAYSQKLTKRLREMFPGCLLIKGNSAAMPGIPDWLILYLGHWAMLEVKRSEHARYNDLQPNQEYYVEQFNNWSFAAFIYPENEEEVLDALQSAFQS